MEGTANYVARRSLGEDPGRTAEQLREARAAEGVRWRFYDSGAALCFLLDRFDPGWKVRSDTEPDLTIVTLLSEALARRNVEPNRFSDADAAGFETHAERDVAELTERQQGLRAELLARPGPRLVVEVPDGEPPFSAMRFDPIHLLVLDGGEVVQANYISLEGPAGTIELTNPDFSRDSFAGTVAVTVAAGSHPLDSGIRQVTIVGIREAPRIELRDDTTTVVAPGLRLELHGVSAETQGDTIRIAVRLGSPTG